MALVHFSPGLPVIIDIFPRDNETGYWGDCTRTGVNGEPSPELAQMHVAVMEAKAKAIAALRVGVTGGGAPGDCYVNHRQRLCQGVPRRSG
ncbi:MAG: hypothetical protein CM1200mP29_07940 [Verrucomicrobiota bacterium]|nr:MAG: hypothetical protein CM1200mP29_07940 [Verrucomicrobiota bacterium]